MEQYTKIPVKAIVRFDASEDTATVVDLELSVKPSPGDKIKFGRETSIPDDAMNYFVTALSRREELLKKSPLGRFLGSEATEWHRRIQLAMRLARWSVIETVITPDYLIAELVFIDFYLHDDF